MKLRFQNTNYSKFYFASFSHFNKFVLQKLQLRHFENYRIKLYGGWNTMHELCFIGNGTILLYTMVWPPIESVEHLEYRWKILATSLWNCWYCFSTNKRRALIKYRPLISAATLGIHIEISAIPLISASPLNTALIRIVTIFYYKLNQNAYGPKMQTIKQWKYFWYLGFFIISGLLIMKIYVSFLFWKKKWQGFDF